MPDLRSDDECGYYKCGRCKGNIRYLMSDGMPDVCSECGYGHGTRNVNDVPSRVRLDLNNTNLESAGSRGNLEKQSITSR